MLETKRRWRRGRSLASCERRQQLTSSVDTSNTDCSEGNDRHAEDAKRDEVSSCGLERKPTERRSSLSRAARTHIISLRISLVSVSARRAKSVKLLKSPRSCAPLTESNSHLNRMTPSLGVLASSALEGDIDSCRPRRAESMRSRSGHLVDLLGDVLELVKVEQLDLGTELLANVVEAPLNVVDGDDAGGAFEESPLGGEL